MSIVTQETVLQALAQVIDPDSGRDVVSAGIISGLVVRDGKVGFAITIDARDKDKKAPLRDACEAAVKKLPGVAGVTAVLTAESDMPSPAARKPAVWNKTPLEHVHKIIAVASGKGGVGKSTTAVNLAHALTSLGKRVGLLDADIYGPSVPHMLHLSGKPEFGQDKMLPLANHGIKAMSIGFITGEEAAIMRGPMISKALTQMLRFTRWGTAEEPLDILLVDMPPGTGDVHLSMAQQVPLSGAIIVTTPQEVAVMDARKCAIMFQKTNVPLLGVIENMSGELFGSGGGRHLAEEMQIPFLGEIAADVAIRKMGDSGAVYTGAAYQAIARQLNS